MASTTIVATAPVDDMVGEVLAPHGRLVTAPTPDEATVMTMLGDCVGLVVRGDATVSAELIAAGPRLRVIGRTGVGYNSIDVAAATERRIPVIYTPGAGARAVAEASMTLMLTLCKRVAHWDEQTKQGNWLSRYEQPPGDLDRRTVGIVGFGRIGQILATMARPFDMNILAHDPYASAERADELGVRLVDLDVLLAESDFICVHALLNDETRGLIDRARLQRVKRGAFLINLARGGLIESLDVVEEALADGRLAGAGLDVFDPEPPDHTHPIFRRANCITAPHCLGASRQAMTNIFASMADDMNAVLSGRRPQHIVNPEVLDG